MHSFTYGSRVIENEQQVRLHTHVRRIGNLLRAVVNFCLTFFLFVIINLVLRNLVGHTNFTFLSVMRFVQENAEVLVGNSALSVITFLYQHSFCLMLALAFSCVYPFDFVLSSIVNSASSCEQDKQTQLNYSQEHNLKVGYSAISYKHKVCFLS